ncbi:MAG TPA: glucuronate isomerase [Anaerohalosphaeraceae bacterium]|nr:glucuronate isomerase [Phycisphaerae bacterium]HOK94539.1 glucuronate isomerase [Anaerohalosphaeraceae bacterium]HOL31761.1 glucuronate isomerase [Anaerohalosphaeraceae bacterium]HOM75004.1 glucuronate isomerase [Anaerohalosphaeraceae bacterium]HPC63255.1 glucuronate isomerase [Anaerohalosphaeraceae bacterium]
MKTPYMHEDFLLQNDTAKELYHNHAEKMPIYDYHCHLPPAQIAEDKRFANLTQIWLYGDHYKWRAMRTNGIDERYCTGDADDRQKFRHWAQTVPFCIRNPLYHWTHLELKKPFGITDMLLSAETADTIYDRCSEMLQSPEFSVRNIMRKWNVRLVCTTEDPLDMLEHHKAIRKDGFEIAVHTAWRPDKAMMPENLDVQNAWIDKLAELTNIEINTFDRYLEAIQQRHNYFHEHGCRLSDHGLDRPFAADYTDKKIQAIFLKIRSRSPLSPLEIDQFKSAMMIEFGKMDYRRGWVQQLHIGALRNNNSRMFAKLGPDTGFDSIADYEIALPLSKYLDKLASQDMLTKTILYNLNPKDNEVIATMLGNFQGDGIPGKIQFGSGWWFLDQMDGMTKQMNALSNLGLLSRFIGMLTDSRSFLSYSRHEYFRRILCNLLGEEVEKGFWPKDMTLLGRMVEDICYNNAVNYFSMKL